MGEPERLQVERRGTVLRGELHGSKAHPLVVFTHGGWMDRRMFDEQLAVVSAAGYRVLTWDLRGHGESLPRGVARASVADMTADLIAILDVIEQPGPAFLVGQSLGGMISQRLALVAPERVAGIVTIGSPCINPDDPKLARRMRGIWRVSGFVNGLLPTALIVRLMARGVAVTPDARNYVRAATQNNTKDSFRWLMEAAGRAGRGLQGLSIEVPVLIVRGERDGSGAGRLTKMTGRHWAERDARASYVEIPDASHQTQQDRPEVFNELLLEFLDTARSNGET